MIMDIEEVKKYYESLSYEQLIKKREKDSRHIPKEALNLLTQFIAQREAEAAAESEAAVEAEDSLNKQSNGSVFMVKWVIASIPALLILALIGGIITIILSGAALL